MTAVLAEIGWEGVTSAYNVQHAQVAGGPGSNVIAANTAIVLSSLRTKPRWLSIAAGTISANAVTKGNGK